jgi:spoIIIJ-associated protein
MNFRFSEGERLDREGAAAELGRILEQLIANAGFDLDYEIEPMPSSEDSVERTELGVRFSGADEELLLEQNGELLQALEYLAVRWLRLNPRLYDHIRFDAANYRADRVEELRLAARVAAQRVIETGQPFRFNPMSARERRIIHLALSDLPAVHSESEGYGEHRQVVIQLAKAQRPRR